MLGCNRGSDEVVDCKGEPCVGRASSVDYTCGNTGTSLVTMYEYEEGFPRAVWYSLRLGCKDAQACNQAKDGLNEAGFSEAKCNGGRYLFLSVPKGEECMCPAE